MSGVKSSGGMAAYLAASRSDHLVGGVDMRFVGRNVGPSIGLTITPRHEVQ